MPPFSLTSAITGIAKNVGTRIGKTLRGKSTEPVNTSVQAPVATAGSQQLGPAKPTQTSIPKVSASTPTALPQQTGIQLDPRFQGMSAGQISDTLENERRSAARRGGADVTPQIGDTVDSSALSPNNTVDALTAANRKRVEELYSRFDQSESEKQALAEINRLTEARNSLESKKKRRISELMKNTEGLTEVGLERVVRGEEAAFDSQLADIDTQITGFRDNVTAIQQSRQEALNNIKMIQDMTGEEQIGGIQTDPLTGEQTAYFRNPLTGEVTTRQLGTVSVAPEVKQIITDDATGAIFAIQTNPQTGQLEQVQIGSVTATPRSGGAGGGTAADIKLQQKQEDKLLVQENLVAALEKYKTAVDKIKDKGITGAFDLNFDPTITRLRGDLQALYKDAYALGALDAGVERLVNNILGLNITSKVSPARHAKALDELIKDTKEKTIFKDETGANVSLNTVGGGEVILDDLPWGEQ